MNDRASLFCPQAGRILFAANLFFLAARNSGVARTRRPSEWSRFGPFDLGHDEGG